MTVESLITQHIDTWTSAVKTKSTTGRGSSKKLELYGVKKLRELILELAVRGKLVPQDPSDEPASVLLERIAAEKAQLVKDKKIKKPKALSPICDDKPFLIPNSWIWSQLGFLTNYGVCDKADPQDVLASTWVLELEDVEKSTSKLLKKVTFKERAFKSSKNRFLKNDVIYGKLRPYLDKVLVADEDGVCTTEMIPIRGYNEDIVPKFLRLVLKTPYFIQYANSSTHGMNLPRMGTEKARDALIPLVPVKEQHRIVAKVDELMTLCDQLEQQTEASIEAHQLLVSTLLNTLTHSADADELMENWARISDHFDTLFTTEESIDQLKQTILQLAVMGKLVPQDPNDEPASVLLERIAEEKAQLIKEKKIKKSQSTDSIIKENCNWTLSEGWVCAELQELCRFIDYRGKNPKKSEYGVRLITAKNIRNGYIKNDPVEFISDELYEQWMIRGLPKKRDILFITEGHTMGYVAQIDLDYLFALAQRTICLQRIGNLSPEYLRIALMSPQFQLMVKDNETGSAAGGIKASKLKRLPIPIPTEREQKNIVERVDCLLAICEQLKLRLKGSQTTQLHLTDAIVEQAV